jgi:hypothetical protein
MIVYSSFISNRLQYISDFIGSELIGNALLLTDDKEEFSNFSGPRINYSAEKITTDEFWLYPHTLLFEKEVKHQTIECFETNNQKAFFKTDGDFPFDIFAATFYLISRYEEYLPYQKDMYGRYAHENSLAYKEGFLNLPLINIWLEQFKNILQQKFPSLIICNSSFTFLPTYDIDVAWAYKYKQWKISAGGAMKDLLKGAVKKISLRRKVVNNEVQDPFDAYGWMDNLHQQYQLKPQYFFLVSEKLSKYDRNILPREPAMQQLIQQHSDKYEIGVHPSWQSGDDVSLIKKEMKTIEDIAAIKITSSRQHYIRFTLPQTFRYLIEAAIKEDFSMGYGSINGFRASVASSFYWYDLEKNLPTDLLLRPFCYMDANSFYEQKFTPQQALNEMRHYYAVLKEVNGTYISIWHNNFVGTDEKFLGWREIYEQFIQEIASPAPN